MLNDEDFDSDSNDEDYVPEGAAAESEDEDINEGFQDSEENDEGSDEDSSKKKGKKKKVGKLKKKQSRKNPLLAAVEETNEAQENEDKETVKDTKKEDSLWADFLADVDEKPAEKPKVKSKNSWASLLDTKKKNVSSTDSSTSESKAKATQSSNVEISKPSKVKITKVFEFAGEEVRVEEEVEADSVEAKKSLLEEAKKDSCSNKLGGIKRPLGLSSVVSILDSKKKKLSTLEKTKIDWLSYKSSEGITEELQSHLKSKDGYLEKKEFLERADVRQFEIERNMRMTKRSNR